MQILSSLKYRNFRLYFIGQAISLLGSWMQGPAVSWLMWRITHSSEWLGAIGFATQIPILMIGLIGGFLADRMNRKRLIIIIQVVATCQAAILAVLTFSGYITAPIILMLSLLFGTVFSLDYPSRQAFLMDMVDREGISNAVALNSSIVHAARVLGPVAAGFIIAKWGEGTCFAVNSVSFLFVIASLLLMKEKELFPQILGKKSSMSESIVEGLKIVWGNKKLRRPIILMAILSIVSMPYIVLLPQVISERFGGGASHLGMAMSMAGLGALSGAAFVASRKKINNLYKIIVWSLFTNGLGLIIFSIVPNMLLAVPVLILMGLSGFLVVAGTQIILQSTTSEESRGRLMSIFTVVFFGLSPIGSLISGGVVGRIGVGWTILAAGIICAIIGLLFIFGTGQKKSKTVDESNFQV